ncbi:MAG: hybrid sensor histidine kinase/response regulator [bacterium]
MKKILVVDDDENIRENLTVRLQKNGFEVLTASNGADSIEMAVIKKPDVVLLDIMMPGMDGFQACDQIKKKTAPEFLPVILVTALNQVEDKIKGLQVGADDFVGKPFQDSELIVRINAFIRIKSLHDKLEESYRELKQLGALKDNLTSLIIHDLKSPIASGIATLTLFWEKHKNDYNSLVEDMISKIKRNYKIQQDLITDILEINRMDNNEIKLEKKKISVDKLIDESIIQTEPAAIQKGISISKSLGERLPILIGDEQYILRVLSNLINNSIKYTPSSGIINISVSFDNEKQHFIFCIRDNGQGVEKEDLSRIFDRYFQVDPTAPQSRRGVGLGLSFCKMAVELHGGKIWIESEKGAGSSFYFTVPV